MPRNDKLQFGSPEPVLHSLGKLMDADNAFEITVTGPASLMVPYIESAPVFLEVVPPNEIPDLVKQLEEEARRAAGGEGEQNLKEQVQNGSVRALQIEIGIPPTVKSGWGVRLTVDPDIPRGASHWYYANGVVDAWVNCSTTVGDADLYFYEDGALVKSSLLGGVATDSVSSSRQAGGSWSLRVYGYATSTYSLSGLFVVL